MTKQPEALLAFADRIEEAQGKPIAIDPQAAAELRRLHEVNQELLEALKDVMYWDNGKPEWDVARAAITKATGEVNV